MPFTLVHPLAVLPLKRWGIFSALVIGSIVPDLPRLCHPFGEPLGHPWGAVWWEYLPLGWLVYIVFTAVMREPAAELVGWDTEEVSDLERSHGVSQFLAVTVCVLAGIYTHLIWDGFTHDGGWALQLFGWDGKRVQFTDGYGLSIATILQDLSSGIGILIVIFIGLRAYRRKRKLTVVRFHSRRTLMMMLALVAASLPAVIMLARDPQYWLHDERRQYVGFAIISLIDVVLIELLAYCVYWQLDARKSRSAGDHAE